MNNSTELTVLERDAIFVRLRELKSQLRKGANRHDRCIALITACICEGFNTRGRIVGAMTHLGFNRGHVILMLEEGQGGNPAQHRWVRGEDGRYALHEETDVTSKAV